MTLLEQIERDRIIAIMRGIPEEKIIPSAEALYNGGVSMVEVTFDQSNPKGVEETGKAIRMLVDYFGDKMSIGAGTVMTIEQLDAAHRAGAKYIISPHMDPKLIEKTVELGMVSLPGVLTPTEVVQAYHAGAQAVKIFPIYKVGGPSYLTDIMAPISHIPMLAVAGVNLDNIDDYLEAGAVGVGMANNILDKAMIEREDYEALTELSSKFSAKVDAFNARAL